MSETTSPAIPIGYGAIVTALSTAYAIVRLRQARVPSMFNSVPVGTLRTYHSLTRCLSIDASRCEENEW